MKQATDNVWSKVVTDPSYGQMSKRTQAATKPYINRLPEVLAPVKDDPFSYKSLINAKLLFLQFSLSSGMLDAHVKTLTKAELGFFTQQGVIEVIKGTLTDLLDRYASTARDFEEMLKSSGITERDMILSPALGLVPEAKALYLKGELTIGKLIEIQPILIVKNTK